MTIAQGDLGRTPVFQSQQLTRRALLSGTGLSLFAGGWAVGRVERLRRPWPGKLSDRVLPGEFEQHDAMLVSWPGPTHPCVQAFGLEALTTIDRFFVAILRATRGRLRTICLVSSEQVHRRVVAVLKRAQLAQAAVQFVRVSFVEPYARDYGPLILKRFDGTYQLLDANYISPGRLPASESVPRILAKSFHMKVEHAPINFEGGNLLSNGSGLLVCTRAILHWNSSLHDEISLTRVFQQQFGGSQVVYLEALDGERSGHVDLFATFTAPNTIVVGEYSKRVDPVNAAILDRNARRLARVRTPSGPLQVVRIPMPPRVDKWWYTYTNVAYANGVLLVPTYATVDPRFQGQAIATYRRLLPRWQIAEVDATSMYRIGGALHCLTLNLFRVHSP